MTCIRFSIPGEPVAKGRPRFANGHAFTPNKTRAYEEIVRLHAMQAMRGKKMLTGPIGILVTAYFSIPKNFTKTKRLNAYRANDEEQEPRKKLPKKTEPNRCASKNGNILVSKTREEI